MVSARIPRFDWTAGQTLPLEIWLLNDRYEPVGPVEVKVKVSSGDTTIFSETVRIEGAAANIHACGPAILCSLAQSTPGELLVRLECIGQPQWSSLYRLLVVAPISAQLSVDHVCKERRT
jgi:hypothetical protein